MKHFKVKYLVRMDDISPYMDHDNFNRLLSLFIGNNIKPLLGIIPDNQDKRLRRFPENPLFWNEIHDLYSDNKISIAMHGYQHVYSTVNGGMLGLNNKSEFAGEAFENQVGKLIKGKEILFNKGFHNIDTFMAPSHSFDLNTLSALKKVDIRYVTDGLTLFPYINNSLVFFPSQIESPFLFPTGIWTLCLHSNSFTKTQFLNLEEFIRKHRQTFLDFEYLKENIYEYQSLIHKVLNLCFQIPFSNVKKIKRIVYEN